VAPLREYEEEKPKLIRPSWESCLEIKPLVFSTFPTNCVKDALFIGNKYVGDRRDNEKKQEDEIDEKCTDTVELKSWRSKFKDDDDYKKTSKISSVMRAKDIIRH
jgi:hypothetical protein